MKSINIKIIDDTISESKQNLNNYFPSFRYHKYYRW